TGEERAGPGVARRLRRRKDVVQLDAKIKQRDWYGHVLRKRLWGNVLDTIVRSTGSRSRVEQNRAVRLLNDGGIGAQFGRINHLLAQSHPTLGISRCQLR